MPVPVAIIGTRGGVTILYRFDGYHPIQCLFYGPSVVGVLGSSPVPGVGISEVVLVVLGSVPDVPVGPAVVVRLADVNEGLVEIDSVHP